MNFSRFIHVPVAAFTQTNRKIDFEPLGRNASFEHHILLGAYISSNFTSCKIEVKVADEFFDCFIARRNGFLRRFDLASDVFCADHKSL